MTALRRDKWSAPLLVAAVLLGTAAIALCGEHRRPVVAPLLVLAMAACSYFVRLSSRDNVLPVFEIGSIFVLVTALYSSMPLINYLAAGSSWTYLSDGRLQQYAMTPRQVGNFAWNHVIYLWSFVLVYLPLRGGAVARSRVARLPSRATWSALIVVTCLLMAYFAVMARFFGLSYWNGYEERDQGIGLGTGLPYVVLQISHNLRAMLFVGKQGILLTCLLSWRRLWAKLVVVSWLVAEVSILLVRFGGRGETVLLLLTTILGYHRFVRRLTARFAALVVFGLLVAFTLMGYVREWRLSASAAMASHEPVLTVALTANNEFQALWATAYDLHRRRMEGTLPPVPWQIYVSDLYLPIPSQLLPFYKWDPSEWYLDVIGERGQGVGFMFGVVAQAVVGFGTWELLLRGAVLGVVLALFHRWYVRHSQNFWVILFYAYMCVWTHYTFRATSFFAVYFILYDFIPFLMIVSGLAALFRKVQHRSHRTAVQPAMMRPA